MVPSSGCIADANTVLNTITADVLKTFAVELGVVYDFEVAVMLLYRREM